MRCPSCGVGIVVDFGAPWTEVCDGCKELDAAAVRLGARARAAALDELEQLGWLVGKRITREIREATSARVNAHRQRRAQ